MHTPRKLAVTAAIAIGLAAGSYGVASAAGGSGSSSAAASIAVQASPPNGQPWGGQRSDETLLSGETKSKVEAAAKEKLSGATVVRTETDADAHAAYEVHMVQADGTPATVYVDKQFNVVRVEAGMPGRHSQQPQPAA